MNSDTSSAATPRSALSGGTAWPAALSIEVLAAAWVAGPALTLEQVIADAPAEETG